eukprot:2952968-Pyramimonas_sp.AAC.1
MAPDEPAPRRRQQCEADIAKCFRKDLVQVSEDKDAHTTWIILRLALYVMMIKLLIRDSDNWVLTSMTVVDLKVLTLAISMFGLPPRFRAGMQRVRYTSGPYMHPLIKAKCFSPTGLHICEKAGRACLRLIVSCVRGPWRRRWRAIGKALQ